MSFYDTIADIRMQIPHDQAKKEKLVVVVGPTASGKTSLAIELATRFNGEVVSADSRQVYRGLDIGTEKITPDEMHGIPHHLIDVADPEDTYSAADFKKVAQKVITSLRTRDKLPIIAGGTLFYIDTLLGKRQLAEVEPNEALRTELEQQTTTELFESLKEKDPRRSETIDPRNRRRLIRALEIAEALGSVPEQKEEEPYDALMLGIDIDTEVLKERIDSRIEQALERGLVAETEQLLKKGVPEARLNEIGLEYRVVLRYLHEKISKEELVTELKQKVWQYAKRQRTWLKRYENIHWFAPGESDRIKSTVDAFLQDET